MPKSSGYQIAGFRPRARSHLQTLTSDGLNGPVWNAEEDQNTRDGRVRHIQPRRSGLIEPFLATLRALRTF